jgi:hypothetical protein
VELDDDLRVATLGDRVDHVAAEGREPSDDRTDVLTREEQDIEAVDLGECLDRVRERRASDQRVELSAGWIDSIARTPDAALRSLIESGRTLATMTLLLGSYERIVPPSPTMARRMPSTASGPESNR